MVLSLFCKTTPSRSRPPAKGTTYQSTSRVCVARHCLPPNASASSGYYVTQSLLEHPMSRREITACVSPCCFECDGASHVSQSPAGPCAASAPVVTSRRPDEVLIPCAPAGAGPCHAFLPHAYMAREKPPSGGACDGCMSSELRAGCFQHLPRRAERDRDRRDRAPQAAAWLLASPPPSITHHFGTRASRLLDYSGCIVTGTPARTALPDSGSRRVSSSRALRLAPGRSAARPRRVPG
jgi:hypothetical protein